MSASFRAYIDESGDEGLSFARAADGTGCSDWFVLTAFMTRKTTDFETVKAIDTVRETFGLPPRQHVHWKKLKHPQKVKYAQILSNLRARAISVCVHKPSLLEPEKFRERYRLYFYVVRHVLERVSWLVRDAHNPSRWGGDGSVEVVFSNRQGMSYKEMKDYLQLLLRMQESGQDIRIDFNNVPIKKISTMPPGKLMGLQLADAAAGALFNGLEENRYGNTEPRYVQTLSPILYRHQKAVRGYGIKIVPREAVTYVEKNASLQWLKELKREAGPGP